MDHLKALGNLSNSDPSIALSAAQVTLICLQRAPSLDHIDEEAKTILADQFPSSRILCGVHNREAYYSLWVKWLSLPALFQPPQSVLQSDAYWGSILSGLKHGPRQKLSSHILRRSISLVQHDLQTLCIPFPVANIKFVAASVHRYCRLFETIVIGRYSNQVQDCLKQLPAACFLEQPRTENFSLSAAWWRALLTAALDLIHSDNVRRLVGNWILDQKIPDISYDAACSTFLVGPLMKWSCQGHLFQSSLTREGHAVLCSHGSRWARFVSCIVRSGESHFTVDVLKAVKEYVRHPHAIGFTLRGLGNVQPSTRGSPKDLEDINTLTSEILSGSSLSQLQNRICYVFVQSILHPSLPVRGLMDEMIVSQFQDCHSNAEIHTMLCSNDRTLPKQNRLFSACLRTSQIQTSELEGPILLALFEDIWRFSLEQELPRTVLEILPQMFFGNASLRIKDKDLREFLSLRLMDLLKLCRTRIYCWNPLASAIYKAYMDFPELPSVLPLPEFVVAFARKPPVAAAPCLLDSAISQEIQDPTIRSRLLQPADEGLGYAMVFDMVNRLRTADLHWGRSVIDLLISPFLAESKEAFKAPNTVLQLVLLLSGRCFHEPEQLADFRTTLLIALASGASPVARFLLEWLLLASYWSHPNQSADILEAIDDATEKDLTPKFTASLLRVASWIAKHDQVDGRYIVQLSSTLVALCTSDRMTIRQEAGWRFWQLMDISRGKRLPEVSDNATNKRINRYIRTLKRFNEPTRFRKLQQFDPQKDQTLSFLVDGDYLLLDECQIGVLRQEDFPKIYADSEAVELPQGYLPLGKQVEKRTHCDEVVEMLNPDPDMPFQSKSFLPLDETDGLAANPKDKGGIILIASLIDSLPNLGGLCRAAEIFGCRELHIANISTVKATAFTSVSVSSESNINIIETTQDALTALLRTKSAEGWTILGIEQTGSSLILGDESTRLPRRAVLVLGAEKTGMPAEVLVECDQCVEIRQWGTTKSLNVQTAAATVMYEWRRQWGDGR